MSSVTLLSSGSGGAHSDPSRGQALQSVSLAFETGLEMPLPSVAQDNLGVNTSTIIFMQSFSNWKSIPNLAPCFTHFAQVQETVDEHPIVSVVWHTYHILLF